MVGAAVIWMLADPPGEGAQSIPASAAEVERVSVSEARAALDEQRAVFLDVRTASDYERSRIPGAVSIPLGELEARLGELDREDWIITYCT
jgi:rhodanese-related sulfurtransferase